MKTYDRSYRFKSIDQSFKGFGLLLLFLNITFLSFGQEDESKRNPYIYIKNRFTVSLGNGFNSSRFTSQIGEVVPRFAIGNIHKLNFDYTFSFGEHFGASFGGGFGFFPFMYRVKENENYEGTSGSRYWHLVDYNMFGNLKGGIQYQRWIGNRYAITGSFGGGIYKCFEGSTSIGSSISTQPGPLTNNSPTEIIYKFKYNYDGQIKRYFYLKSGVDKVLKSDNLIGLSLAYEYFLDPVYQGQYILNNYESQGSFINKGHNISLALSYSFTRAQKVKKAEDFLYKDGLSFKDAKRKVKKERRYIDPKSVFIGVSSGLFFARNDVESHVDFLRDASFPFWSIQADSEIGLKRNFFMQFGLSVAQYMSSIRLTPSQPMGFTASRAFLSPGLSGGMGLRLIGANNINYLNVSAGFGLGFNVRSKGANGSGGMSYGYNGEVIYELTHQDYTIRNMIPTVYLNTSRDFQITKSLYLSLDYRFNLGFVNVYEQRVVLHVQPDLSLTKEAVIRIKGTSNAVQIGLKYKFVPKKRD